MCIEQYLKSDASPAANNDRWLIFGLAKNNE